jgi:hypothetical protein
MTSSGSTYSHNPVMPASPGWSSVVGRMSASISMVRYVREHQTLKCNFVEKTERGGAISLPHGDFSTRPNRPRATI